MASGRSDYWYGMLPGRTILSENQKNWVKIDGVVLEAGFETEVLSYVVPENYRLNIVSGFISVDHPGINLCSIYINNVSVWRGYFDQTLILPLNSNGVFVVEAVEEFTVKITNNDTVELEGKATVFGFEQYLIL